MPDPADQQGAESKYRTGLSCEIATRQMVNKAGTAHPAKMKKGYTKMGGSGAAGLPGLAWAATPYAS